MINRRTFLKGALYAIGLPALGAIAPALAATRLHAVVDGACRDARAFARSCGIDAGGRRDATSLLADLLARDGAPCLGLTRDSQFLVLSRLAATHGYRPAYRGVHHYRNGLLVHELAGDGAWLPALATRLVEAEAAWASALAASAPWFAGGAVADAALGRTIVLDCPADSGGHLVSWCLARA